MTSILLTPIAITPDNLNVVVDAGWIYAGRAVPGREARHGGGLRLTLTEA